MDTKVTSPDPITIILSIIATAISILAFAVSVFNLLLDRRRLKTDAITRNRIDWIKEVRDLIWQFVTICWEHPEDVNAKVRIATKIRLYTKQGDVYRSLLSAIDTCISDQTTVIEHVDDLIKQGQDTLNDVWIRMKREAGITTREDRKYQRKPFITLLPPT